jgi:hypothetical protein
VAFAREDVHGWNGAGAEQLAATIVALEAAAYGDAPTGASEPGRLLELAARLEKEGL